MYVGESTSTSTAVFISLAAMFTASPIMVNSCRSGLPTNPTNTRSVVTPMVHAIPRLRSSSVMVSAAMVARSDMLTDECDGIPNAQRRRVPLSSMMYLLMSPSRADVTAWRTDVAAWMRGRKRGDEKSSRPGRCTKTMDTRRRQWM